MRNVAVVRHQDVSLSQGGVRDCPPHSLCRGKEGLGDVDPHVFFEGTLREEAASAFLATLLEQDQGFRAAFVRRIGGGDGADAAAPKIQVEPYLGGGKWPDVLMELPGLLVLVENKVRPRAIGLVSSLSTTSPPSPGGLDIV